MDFRGNLKIPKRSNAFVKVPLGLALAAAKATPTSKGLLVWLLIVYRCWKEHQLTVTVTNEMVRKFGINRKAKTRALRNLERGGLITVEWRERKTPIVTLVVL
jgi:hypothetical protein